MSHSDLSRKKIKNEEERANKSNAPTKRWQKIGILTAILIAIVALTLKYLMSKGII